MDIELRPFAAGISIQDWKAGRNPERGVQAPRSHILVDGRWVGHVGWDDGEEIVYCEPCNPHQRDAIEDEVERQLGKREAMIASPVTEKAMERLAKRQIIVPGQEDTDNE